MWSKVASKCGPSMLRNIIGPHFDSRNGVFFPFFLLVFLKNLILPAERRRFLKNKTQKKEKTWTTFWLKKRQILDHILTLQHIYICAVKSITGPSLGVFKVNNWAKSKSVTGPRSFSHYKLRVSGDVFLLSYHCVCVCVFLLSGNFLKIAFFNKRVQKLFFFQFSVF